MSDFEERLDANGVPRGWGDRVTETFAGLAAIGLDHFYFQWLDLADIGPLDAILEALRDATSAL